MVCRPADQSSSEEERFCLGCDPENNGNKRNQPDKQYCHLKVPHVNALADLGGFLHNPESVHGDGHDEQDLC